MQTEQTIHRDAIKCIGPFSVLGAATAKFATSLLLHWIFGSCTRCMDLLSHTTPCSSLQLDKWQRRLRRRQRFLRWNLIWLFLNRNRSLTRTYGMADNVEGYCAVNQTTEYYVHHAAPLCWRNHGQQVNSE